MNANELAKKLEKTGWNIPLTEMECFEIATMLRQQQAEMEFLKKEILEKHEDWKHEGQQAANARAEIKALKEPREIIIKGDLYLANVLPNGGMEVRLKKAMI